MDGVLHDVEAAASCKRSLVTARPRLAVDFKVADRSS